MKPSAGRIGIAARASSREPRSTATISWNVDWGLVERAEGDCAGAAHDAVKSAECVGCRGDEPPRAGIHRQVEPKRGDPVEGDVVEIAAVAPTRARREPRLARASTRGRPMPPEAPTTRMQVPESDLLFAEEAFIVSATGSWPASRGRCR